MWIDIVAAGTEKFFRGRVMMGRIRVPVLLQACGKTVHMAAKYPRSMGDNFDSCIIETLEQIFSKFVAADCVEETSLHSNLVNCVTTVFFTGFTYRKHR